MELDLNIPYESETSGAPATSPNADDLNSLNPSDEEANSGVNSGAVQSESTPTGIQELEAKLAPGSTLETLSVVFLLYCEYGRLVGFSVRKGMQEYFRQSTEVRMKLFVCHCEGQPDAKASKNGLAQYRKQ
ncbi:hypothetical protein C2S52_021484 [Perilla frutescens var. hirtella]|nr:hypothetical protein C2S52_021484 [Perilla frutescens var. hirtella]KAH6808070.1 hypothetical protein C2S51_029178 [Perilla frutescens var. frutescens]